MNSYIIIGIAISLILLVVTVLVWNRNKIMEHMDTTSSVANTTADSEAIQNIASVYNGNLMTVKDVNVTGTLTSGKLTSGNIDVSQNINVVGNIQSNNTTQSSSISTGSIMTLGGVGISKNLNVGGNIQTSGTITGNISSLFQSSSGANASYIKFPNGYLIQTATGTLKGGYTTIDLTLPLSYIGNKFCIVSGNWTNNTNTYAPSCTFISANTVRVYCNNSIPGIITVVTFGI